jgi:hypothetical protein
MRTSNIRQEPLPRIRELFELVSGSGGVVTVDSRRAGRRDLSIGAQVAREPIATVSLTRAEATALAALLVGAPSS